MANPYFVQPLGGLDVGAKLTDILESGRQQARLKEWETTAPQVLQSGDPVQIQQLMLKYPEMTDTIHKAMGISRKSADGMSAIAKDALAYGEIPIDRLQATIQQMDARGENTAGPMQLLQKLQQDPAYATKWAKNWLAANEPDTVTAYLKATEGDGGKGTADITNFNKYLELQQTDPEKAKLFGYQTNILKRPGEGSGGGSSEFQKTGAFLVRNPDGSTSVAVGVFDKATGTLTTESATLDGEALVSKLGETAEEETIREVGETVSKESGKYGEKRATELIERGISAAEAVPNIKRGLSLLNEIETGGPENVMLKAKQMFGIEGADEGELSNLLGKAVVRQYRETFGAQFTEAEGNKLDRIEASFGKSNAANIRLLNQLLVINENLAKRGKLAANKRGYTDEAAAIDELLQFEMPSYQENHQPTPGGVQQPAPIDLSAMSDDEILKRLSD